MLNHSGDDPHETAYPAPSPCSSCPCIRRLCSAADTGTVSNTCTHRPTCIRRRIRILFTEQTLAGYSRDLNRYLDASWKYEAAGYYVTNNSEYLHAVKEILGLTEEQFDAFVTADAEQKKTDQIEHHSQSSRLSEISADQT